MPASDAPTLLYERDHRTHGRLFRVRATIAGDVVEADLSPDEWAYVASGQWTEQVSAFSKLVHERKLGKQPLTISDEIDSATLPPPVIDPTEPIT